MFILVFFVVLLLVGLFAGALACEAWFYSGEQQAKTTSSDRI